MKKATGLILSIVLIITISCNKTQTEPFEISIAHNNYSLAHPVLYKLSNKKLTITFENEKDRELFSTTELPKDEIRQLANINIDSLCRLYINPCAKDGYGYSFKFKKKGKSKTIGLINYYHNELSPAIIIINGIVPEKYKIQFNKDFLIKGTENCGQIWSN